MAWIKLDTALFRHPKVAGLAPRDVVALLKLWCWAGDLDEKRARNGHVLFAICREIGVSERALTSLESAGLVHRNGDGWLIHDWDEHQGALIEKRLRDRENARERQRRHRNQNQENA